MSAPTTLRRCLFHLPRLQPLAARRWASSDPPAAAAAAPAKPANPVDSAMSSLASFLDSNNANRTSSARAGTSGPGASSASISSDSSNPSPSSSPAPFRAAPFSLSGLDLQGLSQPPSLGMEEEYHLNIYSHKHNTHITFSKPGKDSIVSLSAGNVGFRKSHRGTYDAAYQLAAHVFKLIEAKNVKPRSVEVVLRGFGQGREAVVKALLGQEGRFLRPVVKRVSDGTRLKFGGTRSKKMRRLG
ncbi:hypothetical protein BZA05DRAFT_410375 [Tricharina praecox]|uniref:uncharacterized protein n=1 Tax=Tricharina praecox TaxID=43433 RepID=UPI00221FDA8C|nr:uncharacterized protein BZA05DRAFT_410375 [Tricharina praecox]KAI5843697.1 hypothetical protein BZA05DRAFT_410375 [Tricharina praecox]